MRSSEEQQHFLEHERFGEQKPGLLGSAFPKAATVRSGLLAVGLGLLTFMVPVLLHIGRDDGGPFFLMASLALICLGALLCGIRLVSYWRRKLRNSISTHYQRS